MTLKQLWRTDVSRDIAWLYIVHVLGVIVPLLMIPYLAHVLGATNWGLVAFALSLSNFGSLITEYGFYVSAQREAARQYENREALGRLFSDVLTAKSLLALIVLLTVVLIGSHLKLLRGDYRLLCGIAFLSVVQGFAVGWYFRAIQKVRIAAAMEGVAKVIGFVLVVIVVRSPHDYWKYFYAIGFAQLVVVGWGHWRASRDVKVKLSSPLAALGLLKRTSGVFIMHAMGSVFTTSNVFILGLLTAPAIVGYYAAAERIVRFIANLMDPIRHALFPRVTRLVQRDLTEAHDRVTTIVLWTLTAAIVICVMVYVFAPVIVIVMLGREFFEAISTLRLLAFLIPVLTLNGGLGFLWILPRHFERISIIALGLALGLNVVLSYLLVPAWQNVGMAWSVILAESLIVVAFSIVFFKDRHVSKAS